MFSTTWTSTLSVSSGTESLPRQGKAKMYSHEAVTRRQCKAIKANGRRCDGWAVWGSFPGRCVAHGGRRESPLPRRRSAHRYQPCHCMAYRWPHRPGGGLCCWPDEPGDCCGTPAGRHKWPRIRTQADRETMARIRFLDKWAKRKSDKGA